MTQHLWSVFAELIHTPFQHLPLVWGIVPLYFGLLLNELTSAKASFRTAVQTGFSFLWAAAQWLYPWFKDDATRRTLDPGALLAINHIVTLVVLTLGALALFSGIRRRYLPGCSFLGYTRFSNYFMIAIFPIQAHYLLWTWDRFLAIVFFAVPTCLLLHFGLMPLRKGR